MNRHIRARAHIHTHTYIHTHAHAHIPNIRISQGHTRTDIRKIDPQYMHTHTYIQTYTDKDTHNRNTVT